MHVVLRDSGGDRELLVSLRNPEATLHDVLHAALDVQAPESVAIDGRVVDAAARALDAGLHEGAILELAPNGTGARPRPPLELAVLTGPAAGRTVPVRAGRWTIGRDATNTITLDDETISRAHAELELDEHGAGSVRDLGSANGTWVDGAEVTDETADVAVGSVVQLGAVAFTVRAPADEDRPLGLDLRRHVGPSGAVAFNRPPRLAGAAGPGALEVPSEPGDPPPAHFSIASTVGPLVLAVVMVAITRDLRFALFSLLSPVIGIGTYVESKRRNTTTKVKDQKEYRAKLRELQTEVGDAGAVERARRRQRTPDPAEVLRRVELPSMRLWERRPNHDDFLSLYAGLGDVAWQPQADSPSTKLPEQVSETLKGEGLRAAPVAVELAKGGVVGIVGDRRLALATARSLLCQAAVHHGPADLTVGVFVDEGRDTDWEWTKWLPHTRSADGDGEQWLSARRERSEALLRRLTAGAASGTALVVLDSDLLIEGRNAPARELLRGGSEREDKRLPVAGIVVSSSRDRLPAACNTVIEIISPDGDAIAHRTDSTDGGQELIVAGLDPATARRCARDLARFEDPELSVAGAGLPDSVRLLPLLELDAVTPDAIRRRWQRAGTPASPAGPVGVTEQGVFSLDLERDGPHALVGGTTGSGKSELLRSLIAALAATTDPRQLTFLLMDFKGGAAFDACARLPHTVGMVTDLDEALVERALRALEAELQYRERLLRKAGADNLRAYHERDHDEPLPRLVVVIDEFAKMAREQPELLAALVDVAQRGRTLGVHLILATQRPAGVVNDHIRTNTNLRIALRVQDAADSTDVIGDRSAAEISRHRPGRAYFRLGPDEVVPLQSALITCVTDATSDTAVEVAPFEFGATAGARQEAIDERMGERPSDLARLVDAIIEANDAEGIAPPRKPWPEPLPSQLDLAQLDGHVALADEPRRQRQFPVGWNLDDGNLLLFGIPGSGTTTALASLVLSLSTANPPDRLEVYAFDNGAGELRALETLPHTGSVILAGDRERQMRLIRRLRRELDERRTLGRSGARTIVLIDNLAALRSEFDDVAGLELMDELARVYADGPQSGIHMAVTADRPNTVPTGWMAVTTQKWLFRLADPYDYVSLGLTVKDIPYATPGRAVMAESKLQIQLGRPLPSLAEAAAVVAGRHPGVAPVAAPVGVLPTEVTLSPAADLHQEPWRIGFGIREADLDVAELVLYEGEHAIVAGPARSGKSLTLWTLAETLRASGAPLHIAATGGRRSPLPDCPALDRYAPAAEAGAMLAQLRVQQGPIVLLIDDAEGFDDVDGAIAGLLGAGRHDLHVIAAARADSLRSLYGHWTQEVRKSKVGVLLRPNIDYDGDLTGATLPRRAPVAMTVGRGYLCHNGEAEIVQVALPQDWR
ncbi:FtsK/SpoIIIE domain-containing protein [Solirubrobacter soli]|uniref:FtsK/SpoIIIE domain-containing protein n=1 Tax=Solirubrobacter soli TaxID=363832 RepID=UPI00040FD4FC|nr:FtsK/SpoIIIE domain-containing protein [Solirubrobacter soli]